MLLGLRWQTTLRVARFFYWQLLWGTPDSQGSADSMIPLEQPSHVIHGSNVPGDRGSWQLSHGTYGSNMPVVGGPGSPWRPDDYVLKSPLKKVDFLNYWSWLLGRSRLNGNKETFWIVKVANMILTWLMECPLSYKTWGQHHVPNLQGTDKGPCYLFTSLICALWMWCHWTYYTELYA